MSLRQPVQLHQYRGHRLMVPPVVEPVSLGSVKATLTLDGPEDDEILTGMIRSAREFIEEITGLAMIEQEWRLSLDAWPGGREAWWDGVREMAISALQMQPGWVKLPRYPLATVDAVTVFAEDGTPSVVNIGATFDVDTYQKPGRMALKRGSVWPVAMRTINAIQIDYTAGYGSNPSFVPAPLAQAVRQMAAYLYSHRGDGCDVGDAYSMSGAAAMADRYRVVEV